MRQLYFFDADLDYVLRSDGCGEGFRTYPLESEDNDYFYYGKKNRVHKNTHKIEFKNIFTREYEPDRCDIKFYPTKELWEKAKSEYFAKLLSDNETEKQKILKSMEDK